MKILVICQDYPNSRNPSVMTFAHARDVSYREFGHEVEVLSFAAKTAYERDGIPVFPEIGLNRHVGEFDVWVMHMPNLRNHLRWLLKHRAMLKRLIMIIHGHEFITWTSCVPQVFPIAWNWKTVLKQWAGYCYDWLKLKIWRIYFQTRLGRRTSLIFVSDYILKEAERCIGVSFDNLGIEHKVIHNPIHRAFEGNRYTQPTSPLADFVTIRPFDEPKYGVDIVCRFARSHPRYTFHIHGRGEYFKHCQPPPNVTVIEQFYPPQELPKLLGQYRCALLPTRWDSQGVLMCEIAAFGMPLLVSDLEICRQMVGTFPNVGFFSNDLTEETLRIPFSNKASMAVSRFCGTVLAQQELDYFISSRAKGQESIRARSPSIPST
jgi:glycosyltransferase involved in cell wall biosynthesis